ncbi:MAG: 23S rRNA (adenine(2503)-C(2))-methyltransferase RlmN, partial [Thermoanaerobaculia bacterium]
TATKPMISDQPNARRTLPELSDRELGEWLAAAGEPAYRADQIRDWVFRRGAASTDEMTDLPAALRRRLAADFAVRSRREMTRSRAPDGTTKLLLAWPDGATTECVMIPGDASRRTACLSTQVGCDVGCTFCASGIGGSRRDLSVGEVLEQALAVGELLAAADERLSHVVFMGMGEPLANYHVTVAATRRLNADHGLGIGQRRITISTVGLPKQIERLAGEGLQTTLAVSLHAPTDALRRELIPWARGIPLARLLAACRRYFEGTGREVTFEYCLLAGVNDKPEHAEELAEIARDLRANVNLLMYNPVPTLPFARPSRNSAIAFLKRLRGAGVNVHLRESRGLEADAACGQLRRRAAAAAR